jgi:minichromosome maintenance protein 10
MKNGENLQPVKKKTRFVTEKGIREAGRESFGGEVAKAVANDLDDDSDDDLDIVRE